MIAKNDVQLSSTECIAGSVGSTADAADVWWNRWSLGPLPMLRATVRPQTRVKCVNQALVDHLGFTAQDTPSIVRSVLAAVQSYSVATGESTASVPQPCLMTIDLARRDGSKLALRMFLVAHRGRQSQELGVVGVGLPASTALVTNRIISSSSHVEVST